MSHADERGSQPQMACVIGWPLKNTLSPVIHNAAFSHHGDYWAYVAFPCERDQVENAITGMRLGAFNGMNVTIPYKEVVSGLVDELDESASAINAVNTVVVMPGRKLKGYSTDGEGLVRAITLNAGIDPRGKTIAVLGAGGAARSAIDALIKAGAATIYVVNRTRERAVEAASLSPVCVVGKPRVVKRCDIIVNATSVGMDTEETPIKSRYLHVGQLVVDAVYSPLETRLLREAKQRGAAVLDGLWMLIHQACVAQRLWLGREPDPQVMREAAVRELEARAK